ncbi:MAG: Fe(3+) ABC transporter substrate-binding protein [Rhodospirillales bacterium]|nr:Fe(3+) ABC transporter substrate-binding protein [Rhodospirillales bacterium]
MTQRKNLKTAGNFVSAVILGAMALTSQAVATEEVNLYSFRQPFLIEPMLKEFTRRNGIAVNVVYAKQGVLERLRAEGPNSPADAVLTVDIGRLHDLVEAEILQPVASPVLAANIPAQYRHPDGLWFGLTTRARIIFVSRDRVGVDEVRSYADLAAPHMKGRVCSRSGKSDYNISLLASIIAHEGEQAARDWLRGVKSNLARKPQGNDRAQAKAIMEGVCDAALANTYYMGHMLSGENPEQKAWAEAVRIVFPNQDDRGTHVNISGAALVRGATNRDNAVKLIEFLSDDDAQRLYAEANLEYPVKAGAPTHPLVESWGSFKADTIELAKVAKYRPLAARIVDEVAFDL